jgi:hypothetical protein
MPRYLERNLARWLDSKSTNFTRKTASNLKAIEEVNVTGIEKSDY